MKELSDLTLRLYSLDALDPDQAAVVHDRLAADPALRERLVILEQQQLQPPTPGPWLLPPPSFGWGPAQRASGHIAAPVLDAAPPGEVNLGDRVRIQLPKGLDDHGVIVLRWHDGAWTPALPAAGQRPSPVSALPRADGHPVLDLQARPPTGAARLAVVLWPPERSFEPADPWPAVQQAVRNLEVPAMSVAFRVLDPWALAEE